MLGGNAVYPVGGGCCLGAHWVLVGAGWVPDEYQEGTLWVLGGYPVGAGGWWVRVVCEWRCGVPRIAAWVPTGGTPQTCPQPHGNWTKEERRG